MENNFTNITLRYENMDIFYIRASILKALKDNLQYFYGTVLDVGCGSMPYKDIITNKPEVIYYVGLDIETAILYDDKKSADYTWDGIKMPFDDNTFETSFGTEVLEHCPNPEIILKEIYRVLKPGGIFFFTVPFLWPLHEVPNDEYRFTPFSLKRKLVESGFNNILIQPLGGWHASMAQMLGLWICRAPISKNKRNFLSWLLMPLYKYLLKKDIKETEFSESSMITGLYGVAYK